MAVGSFENNDDGDAAVWTSVDGMSWSRVAHDEAVFGGVGGDQRMHSVTAGGSGFGGRRSGRGPDDRGRGSRGLATEGSSVDFCSMGSHGLGSLMTRWPLAGQRVGSG